MSRIVYVNGAYVPEEEAKISVFDRAFLFGDGVYEGDGGARPEARRFPAASRPPRPLAQGDRLLPRH
jgi:hypothetical protein